MSFVHLVAELYGAGEVAANSVRPQLPSRVTVTPRVARAANAACIFADKPCRPPTQIQITAVNKRRGVKGRRARPRHTWADTGSAMLRAAATRGALRRLCTATRPLITTESGLRYREVHVPDDGVIPARGDNIRVHYTGRLDDGTVFDSSVDRGTPLEFRLGRGDVIRGWDEGLSHGMRVGGRRQLVIPPELGYGARGAPPAIPPNALLHFDVELVSIGGSVWTKIASLAKGFMK